MQIESKMANLFENLLALSFDINTLKKGYEAITS